MCKNRPCNRWRLILAAAIKNKYPKGEKQVVANSLGTDIGAKAASITLTVPQLPGIIATLVFTGFIITAQILVPYKKYVKILKYLVISLFAYVITAIIVGGSWNDILVSSIIPHIEFAPTFAVIFVAIFGATMSPYIFFWQASEQV